MFGFFSKTLLKDSVSNFKARQKISSRFLFRKGPEWKGAAVLYRAFSIQLGVLKSRLGMVAGRAEGKWIYNYI